MKRWLRIFAAIGLVASSPAAAQPASSGAPSPAEQLMPFEPAPATPEPAAPAQPQASAGPNFSPTRDVTVEYRSRTEDSGKIGAATEYFSAELGRKRVEFGSGYWLIDDRTNRVFVVAPQLQTVIETSGARELPSVFPPGSKSKRQGPCDAIAGLASTNWRMTAPNGFWSDVCVTDDGVVLRIYDDVRTTEAAKVSFGPLDPTMFAPPANWRRVEAPTLGPTRDALVTYKLPPGAPTAEMKVSLSFAKSEIRWDEGEVFYIYDLRRLQAFEVSPQSKTYVTLPPARATERVGWTYGWPLDLLRRHAVFTRGDNVRIAGVPCANWHIVEASRSNFDACIANDGLMLRLASNGKTIEAANVVYAPQTDFGWPLDYRETKPQPQLGK